MSKFLLAWLLCQGLDTGTTAILLHQGGREVNGLIRPAPLTLKVSLNAGLLVLHHRHPSKALPLTMAISGCAAGGWNLAQLHGAR